MWHVKFYVYLKLSEVHGPTNYLGYSRILDVSTHSFPKPLKFNNKLVSPASEPDFVRFLLDFISLFLNLLNVTFSVYYRIPIITPTCSDVAYPETLPL